MLAPPAGELIEDGPDLGGRGQADSSKTVQYGQPACRPTAPPDSGRGPLPRLRRVLPRLRGGENPFLLDLGDL